MRTFKIRGGVVHLHKETKGGSLNPLKMLAATGRGVGEMREDDTNLERLRDSLRKMNINAGKKKKRFIEL